MREMSNLIETLIEGVVEELIYNEKLVQCPFGVDLSYYDRTSILSILYNRYNIKLHALELYKTDGYVFDHGEGPIITDTGILLHYCFKYLDGLIESHMNPLDMKQQLLLELDKRLERIKAGDLLLRIGIDKYGEKVIHGFEYKEYEELGPTLDVGISEGTVLRDKWYFVSRDNIRKGKEMKMDNAVKTLIESIIEELLNHEELGIEEDFVPYNIPMELSNNDRIVITSILERKYNEVLHTILREYNTDHYTFDVEEYWKGPITDIGILLHYCFKYLDGLIESCIDQQELKRQEDEEMKEMKEFIDENPEILREIIKVFHVKILKKRDKYRGE